MLFLLPGGEGQDVGERSPQSLSEVKVGERPEVAVETERELEHMREHRPAAGERHRQVPSGTLPVPTEVVVPPIVNGRELLEAAEALEVRFDVELIGVS